MVEACTGTTCLKGNQIAAASAMLGTISTITASNAATAYYFGNAVAISGDGNTIAVGAWQESSGATGINGNQSDTSAPASGAVYVFTQSANVWTQQAYIKASNTGAGDKFGLALSLSNDGNTLAVGATLEDSINGGINGDGTNNSATDSGAVYVFTRSGTWSQEAYIKATNIEPANYTESADHYGATLALSADGNTLVVGSPYEDSAATGINGTAAHDCTLTFNNNCLLNTGALYVYTRSGVTWSQQAYIKASNREAGDNIGQAVSISSDGNTIVAGAPYENSWATGVDGNQSSNGSNLSGAAYVFVRSVGTWTQQAYLKASNTGKLDFFGTAVSISGDGSTVAIGAPNEQSAATGINGNQSDNSEDLSGAVYIFTRSVATWTQQAYIKASNTRNNAGFGGHVVLSNDGNIMAAGATGESSSAVGVDGMQNDNTNTASGAVYVFSRNVSTWSQKNYVKAKVNAINDTFSQGLDMSADGSTLVVGSSLDSTSGTDAGGVFIY